MKVLLLLTLVILTLAVVSAEQTCPDGGRCDGECCKKFFFGNSYYCCRGIFKCQTSAGIGYCSPLGIRIPIPVAKGKPSFPEVKHLWTESSVNAKDAKRSAGEDKVEFELTGQEYLAPQAALALANSNMAIDMEEDHDSGEYMFSDEN